MDIKIEPKKNYQAGIRLTEETYLKLKVLAVSKKSTVGEVLRAIIEIYFKKENDR
jgi:predicted DNA-binding protein